jgi:N-acetylglucosaminyl-diphospho-decaprenol L-rhamnosyltransferase
MNVSVDVVVPVYGNWAVTASCLRHLRAQTLPHRVILVDDASPDDTLLRVRSEFPEVDVVEMGTNSGFAAACNRGIATGTSDVVVLVNNDVDAKPDMLELLVQPFADDPRVGSAVPLLLGVDGSVDSFGITADKTMAGFVRFHGAPVTEVSSEQPTMLGPYGAVAAYRRLAIDAVGHLDEGIFMYGEELDLALRLRNSSWAVAAVPAAQGIHVGGATAGKGSAKQRYLAGFGRGYLLRAYGVLQSPHAMRAIVTEVIVCGVRLAASRDLASLKGRWAGWQAGKKADRRSRPVMGIETKISLLTSLRMRSNTYWVGELAKK